MGSTPRDTTPPVLAVTHTGISAADYLSVLHLPVPPETTEIFGYITLAELALAVALQPGGINAQTGTTYTIALADVGSVVTLDNADAITLTVPANATTPFPVGARVDICQTGMGTVTVAAGGGVTINSVSGNLSLSAQYAAASLLKTATDTWLLIGYLGEGD